MDSIIDTNRLSQRVQPQHHERKARFVGLGQDCGSGKHKIVSPFAPQGQVQHLQTAVSIFVVICGFSGCGRQEKSQITTSIVTGASMSPTIWGDQTTIQCGDCSVRWQANWQPAMRPQGPVTCWNCGYQVTVDNAVNQAGDQVAIDTHAYATASPQIDDIVAIRDADSVRIKRVVAVGGQVISSRGGLLFRDDLPLTTDAPWIVVHDDSYRHDGESWWQGKGAANWIKTDQGFKVKVTDNPACLIYQHRLPYNRLRPDRVRDDYGCNLSEGRRLREVDTLAVRAELNVTADATLRWWNWRRKGAINVSQELTIGHHHVDIQWNESSDAYKSPQELSAEQPICLVVERGQLSISKMIIKRPVIYWIDEDHSDSIKLPMVVPDDQYFVIGDNVPMSIDSRQQGTVSRSSIVGKVKLTLPPGESAPKGRRGLAKSCLSHDRLCNDSCHRDGRCNPNAVQ